MWGPPMQLASTPPILMQHDSVLQDSTAPVINAVRKAREWTLEAVCSIFAIFSSVVLMLCLQMTSYHTALMRLERETAGLSRPLHLVHHHPCLTAVQRRIHRPITLNRDGVSISMRTLNTSSGWSYHCHTPSSSPHLPTLSELSPYCT